MSALRHLGVPTVQLRIRIARQSRGWTIEQAAARMGVAKGTWANLETRCPDLRITTVERIADALHVAPEWVAFGGLTPLIPLMDPS